MALAHAQNTVRFGQFELDLRTGQVTKNGAKIRLSQQPIQVLSLLLETPGEIVTREEFRRRPWSSDVFVDFDHGLNKSIQKLREALGDSAGSPRYIETIPRIGYRFTALANEARPGVELPSETGTFQPPAAPALPPRGRIARNRRARWILLAASATAFLVLAFGGMYLYRSRHRPLEVRYTQLTDFTDSAVAPALSPDGRMVAFFRGGGEAFTSDPIYVKMLPDGEAHRVTGDNRRKYGLAFSPDGSEIAYTVSDGLRVSTYEVSALGGESHLLMNNAAGLVWLDSQHLLFSELRGGIHLGVVTSTLTGAARRDIYFPAHERGMARSSYPSPNRRWALVVEMNDSSDWVSCRLVGLQGQGVSRPVGPATGCISAGWSPDGAWMYFSSAMGGPPHLWRQRFPEGTPEQMTSGPTEEGGVAVEPGGRALITSAGTHETAVWIHDGAGDRQLSSEGEVMWSISPAASFSPDNSTIYYMLRRWEGSAVELWRTVVDSGKDEAVFPGISMIAFDLSPDGREVVYETAAPGGTTQLWLSPLDRSVPASKVGDPGGRWPRFGPQGRIFFEETEGNANYLLRMNPDGSNRSKVLPYPITEFEGVSPGRRWLMVTVPRTPDKDLPAVMAIPLDGGPARRMCTSYCLPIWSTDGKFLFVPVEDSSGTGPGRSLVIPVGPGESLADFPAQGIARLPEPSVVPGAQSIACGDPVPGKDPEHYAWVKVTVHRNLYRISLP
jgi:DNA-binding winged helix-turn-helix (wHTH) protein/Tol biopolymer transport system component